ncbi:unnamed protein product [Colias eurytheme]|nr:unnamed protein product [Colias eurytheme]
MEVFLVLPLFILTVNSVAIRGPEYTRYDPCSLGLIYFEKSTNTSWQGVINFSLYPNISNAAIEISFDKPMTIYGASHNTIITATDDWKVFVLKPSGELPPRYVFYLAENNNGSNVPIVTQVKLNDLVLCNDIMKKDQTIQSLNMTKPDDTVQRQVCGRRALQNAELNSVKTDVKAGDWPWHVAVLITGPYDVNQAMYQCGGNIISKTAVLTAGHCIFLNRVRVHVSQFVVEAGIDNLLDAYQVGRQSLRAVDIIIHPAFHLDEATGDLAIIRVNRFRYTEYVQPICIWGPSYNKETLYGETALVAGFGTTEENKLSNKLRSTYTVVQNDTTCIAYSPQLYMSLLNEFTFCAGLSPDSGTSPLQGDSGGGLVVAVMQPDHKVSWFLRGLLSKCGVPQGKTMCDPTFYVVYTDVAPHYGWVYHHSGLSYLSNIVD